MTCILAPAEFGDYDEVKCSECGAVFTIIWRRSVETYAGVQNCPFCGERTTDGVTPTRGSRPLTRLPLEVDQ